MSLPQIQAAVLDWYTANGRDLAFRRTRDPWAILVSEVIAQQTQATRAADAWERFIAQFPTPAALAAVSPATVIRAWRGLGYNRRAVRLREAAIRIVDDHAGLVPDSLEALLALPGVGPYTARAVLAFAFDRPIAPLDTNVQRVLDRALGPLPTAGRPRQAAADGFVPSVNPAAWSHALMDIGATICVARNPRCDACPIRGWCAWRATSRAVSGGPESRAASKPFPSTTRWLRGGILDRLRDAPDGLWVDVVGPIGTHSSRAVQLAVDSLAHDELVEQEASSRRVRLVASPSLRRGSGHLITRSRRPNRGR